MKLSASPALHQTSPIISVITQINARLRLTVQHVCKTLIQLESYYFIMNKYFTVKLAMSIVL